MSRRHSLIVLAATASLGACTSGHASGMAAPAAAPEVAPAVAVPTAPGARLDSARLFADLAVLAADSMEGRRTGKRGGLAARAYVLRAFRDAGLRPLGDSAGSSYEQPFSFTARRDSSSWNGANVVGVVRGTESPDRYIVVSAHYDHVGIGRPVNGDSIYNGADDNASGTAALMAMARWYAAHPARHSLVFAAFDAEELGLQGSRAFVARGPVPVSSIALDVNMDMVSHNAAGELYASGAGPYPALRPVLEQVAASAPVKLRLGHDDPKLGKDDDWTNQSDQGPFNDARIPFVYFGVEDHPDYHRPSDSAASITPVFYANAVRTIFAALDSLDRAVR